jgi:hypothetical protein
MDFRFLCETYFDKVHPDLKIEIKDIEVLNRKKLTDDNIWEDDTPAIFVGVDIKEFPPNSSDISEELSNLTGFEFNIYRI